MRRFLFLAISMLLLVSCNDYRKIEVSNVSINSVKIKSTSKATLEVKAEVKNPTKKCISLLNAEGMLLKENKDFILFSLADTVTLAPGADMTLIIPVDGKVVDPIGILSSGLDFKSWNKDNFSVEAYFTVKMGKCPKQRVKINNTPVRTILDYLRKR